MSNKIMWLELASTDVPASAKFYGDLGLIYANLGCLEEAAEILNRAVQINPDVAPVWNNLGAVQGNLGNVEEAARAWERALQLDPTLEEARENLRKHLEPWN